MNRRHFLQGTAGALSGLVLGGCRGRRADTGQAGARPGIPLLEVEGSPYEIGRAIGKRFGDAVREGLRRRSAWFAPIRTFMRRDPANRRDPFVRCGQEHLPGALDELRGWADGAGLDFDDLLALNLKNELSTMMGKQQAQNPGCSTLVLAHRDRRIIAHNEDGDMAYRDLMFLVRASQPGKPAFLALTYPGILCGNGPVVNEAGLAVTTNFISSQVVRNPGVPRYFISRAAITASSSEEAVRIVTHPQRAYSFHFNLGSRSEQKILSVETAVDRHAVQEISGLYVHTNHLVLPTMRQTPQDTDYVKTSSMSRYRVLADLAGPLRERLDEVDWRTLVEMLSSHQGAPFSPCRHPVEVGDDPVRGATLATAVFSLDTHRVRLFQGNPCRNRPTVLSAPAQKKQHEYH